MKKTVLIATLILLVFTGNAQNAIAKIKYEQAEEAFEKNDFAGTLVKLDEAQKLLGTTNPKILFLRIMAEKGQIEKGAFDFSFLEASRKNVQYYLKNYETVEGIEDKYRQVYLFSEDLQKHPISKQAWDQKVADRLAAINKTAAEKAERLRRADVFVDSLCQKWKWKTGQNKTEFKDYTNKLWFWVPFWVDSATEVKSGFQAAEGEIYSVTAKDRKAIGYSLCMYTGSEANVQQKLEDMTVEIRTRFPERALSYTQSGTIGVWGYSNSVPTEIFLYKKELSKKKSMIILGFREWKQ